MFQFNISFHEEYELYYIITENWDKSSTDVGGNKKAIMLNLLLKKKQEQQNLVALFQLVNAVAHSFADAESLIEICFLTYISTNYKVETIII